jgi:hypothetical protein
MSLEGRIENGRVVFEHPVPLPEGTVVRVDAVAAPPAQPPVEASFLEVLGEVVGALDDLPEDLAENHDHYLHGTAKRR